ncbi:hypothetical protein BJ878DRAFT_288653 [Calycina marina]|uniref:Zn(2)-C6 fungal-type domain-containing protein n=1 Tax=Calycina marina TaxID=1763456 RepID=A0A9P8CJB5_9HELO|nr:hypothetical protein BJ878DRAFT_288653 [Calycina marina]
MGPTLRASCDNCNGAKVKCTKQQPQCQRCKKNNIDCIYGISLRAGKRASQQPQLPKKVETPPPLPTDWNMDLTATASYSSLDMDVCPSIFEYDMPFPLEGYQSNVFPKEDIYSGDDIFLPMADLTYPEHIHKASTATNTSTSHTSPAMSDSLFLSLSTGMARPSHTQQTPNSLFTSCSSCFRGTVLTLSTLQQLSDSTHISFDVALVHNKEAVALCLATLKCSCAADSTVVLLVASLLAKIIHIYERPCGAWKAVEHPNMSHDSKAVTARLTLGAYNVDEGDEEKLKAEIVKMELRKVDTGERHF